MPDSPLPKPTESIWILAMDRFIAGTQDNGTFLKHDGQWEHVLGGDGLPAFHGEVEDVVYASLYYGQVFRSDDGGNAFVEIAGNAGGGVDSQGTWLTPWAVTSSTPTGSTSPRTASVNSANRGADWTATVTSQWRSHRLGPVSE